MRTTITMQGSAAHRTRWAWHLRPYRFCDMDGPQAKAQVVVLDGTLPTKQQVSLLDHLALQSPRPAVVLMAPRFNPFLLSARYHPLIRASILDCGFGGWLLAPVIRGVCEGLRYYTTSLVAAKAFGLTGYEYDLLRFMALGFEPGQMARHLKRSMHSVYSAQYQVRRKLGVSTNEQALLVAIQHHIVAILCPDEV